MAELFFSLLDVVAALFYLIVELLRQFFYYALALFWLAWSLWAIDWRKLGPALSQGAAVPLVLIAIAVGVVWAGADPRSLRFLGVDLPNFYWQFGVVGLMLTVTLACGWLQLRMGWYPEEVQLFPEGGHHGHGHGHDGHGHAGHGHAHDHGHGSGH
ncbi:MAG TPA: hypothetical protein PKD86_09785 [Gemmatales bacterium]|nr:hypothetical protein [Gemmatales bacterium]HMP59632.1 hypothetical protein [Gemmatales bacterium]